MMNCENCRRKDSIIFNLTQENERLKELLSKAGLRFLDVSKITTDEIKKILNQPDNESSDNDND